MPVIYLNMGTVCRVVNTIPHKMTKIIKVLKKVCTVPNWSDIRNTDEEEAVLLADFEKRLSLREYDR